jgi:hypothetical protein
VTSSVVASPPKSRTAGPGAGPGGPSTRYVQSE